MRRSNQFVNIMTALAEAKMQMRSLEKNSKNPHFKSEYADINEVFDVLKKPLYDNGVALNQFPDIVNGQFVLTTVLMHLKSGEFIETDYHLLLEKNTSQGQGSALTYAKRQALTAIFSLHEFDDDGNSAENHAPPSTPQSPQVPQASSDLPKPTVKSLMQKYAQLHKVPDAGKNQVCLDIFAKAHQMHPLAAEDYIKTRFEREFGDTKPS